MDSVNETYKQAKVVNFKEIFKFIILGFFKMLFTIITFGAIFWIIRHF